MIRLLSAFITLLICGTLTWWFEPSKTHKNPSDSLLILIWGSFCSWLLFKIWWHPTPKTDRSILLLSLSLVVYLPIASVAALFPDHLWFPLFGLSLVIALPLIAKWYRPLEQAWAKDGDISSLPTGQTWPLDETWLTILCTLIFMIWTVFHLTSLAESESILELVILGIFLPAGTTRLLHYFGRKTLKRHQASAAFALENQTAWAKTSDSRNAGAFPRGPLYLITSCLLFVFVIHQLINHAWNSDPDLCSLFYALSYSIVLVAALGTVLYCFWLKPSSKTDRIAILVSLAIVMSLAGSFVEDLFPKHWSDNASWLFWTAVLPIYTKVYRYYELLFVKKSWIHGMPGGQPWPVNIKWTLLAYTTLFLGWLFQQLGVTGYDQEDTFSYSFWQILLPVLITCGPLYLRKKYFTRYNTITTP